MDTGATTMVAKSIAKHSPVLSPLGRASSSSSIVVSGPELPGLNEHQWRALASYEEIVFARTTPEQKLRIVREFQRDNVGKQFW